MIMIKKKITTCSFFAMAFLWGVSYGAEVSNVGGSVTIESIKNNIAKNGANKTVELMYADHKEWGSILVNIASGKSDWVKVATLLYQGSDGGSAEMLVLSLGEALEHSPKTVFENTKSIISLRNVCGSPDIDLDKYNSRVKAISAIKRRQNMVKKVKDGGLLSAKKECLGYLELAKKSVSDFFTSSE